MNKNEEIDLDDPEKKELISKGGKPPFSLYTRRVIDISKISEFLTEDSSHGLCGSHNLGNTCFMNSSIACLSNCTELTYYFLSGEYKKDINRENKLGMGGALAESWADLLHDYWVGSQHVGNPSDLKRTFGNKIKRFSGYNQQDSNEFIDLFLENLNEDLNSVTKREYIELKSKGENESDKECAKRYWDNYLKRNNSIITDLFCGQIKSTLTCPKCGFINIGFDPFNTLNLNIPESSHRKYQNSSDYIDMIEIFYVPRYNLRTPIRIKTFDVPKKAYFKDWVRFLKNEINFKYHGKIDKLILNEIKEKLSMEFIDEQDDTKNFKYLSNSDNFHFCHDIMDENENIYIPVNFKDKKGASEFPRIIMVSEKDCTMNDLRKKIYFNFRKLILSPFKQDNEDTDELSKKIFDYTKDVNIEDGPIFDLINKEYEKLFNSKGNPDDEINEQINNFINDIPFQIFLTKNIEEKDTDRIYIINKNNFFDLSKEFIESLDIKSYNEPITNLLKFMQEKEYNIEVEFNTDSNYINSKLYKLNNCITNKLTYNEIEEGKESDQDSGIITLKKCFNLFSSEEKLKENDEWFCPKCKQHVLANKKMELYYTPKILIICFKRFIKHSTYWEKNEENIIFPINNLDMKEFIVGPDKDHSVYDLFAVSEHYGGTGFGHYTAVCKNFDKWYSYNDSSVHETSESNIISSGAYVLFYRRRTD